MIRQFFLKPDVVKTDTDTDTGFSQRGKEVSRVESFSDAVFGFSITLLVISLTPIGTFTDLIKIIDGLIGFGIEFTLIVSIWLIQFQFFRGYNLQDRTTVVLNMMLLFVTLFYVYPLRFLFSVVAFGNSSDLRTHHIISDAQIPQLFVIYGIGYSAVFALFTLMLLHAYQLRDTLALTETERFDTRTSILRNVTFILIGVLSIVLAITNIGASLGATGWIYGLIAPVLWVEGALRRRQRHQFQSQLDEHPVSTVPSAP